MAFGKALKDDFVHARVAGLMATMACIDCFEIEELASKVIGVVAGALVDQEKYVPRPVVLPVRLSKLQGRPRSGIQSYRAFHEKASGSCRDNGKLSY